jgi:hypothetical protein
MLCTQLCTIINNCINQGGVTGGGWGGAMLQSLYNATVAMYITLSYYHQSERRSRRSGVPCYAHHRVLLIIINQSARRRLRSRRGRERRRGNATYITVRRALSIVNFKNQREAYQEVQEKLRRRGRCCGTYRYISPCTASSIELSISEA